MIILITGATGLIGKEIVKRCHEEDISVHYLTTSKEKIESQDNYKGFYWNPKEGVIDSKCFEDVDAIINLAGSNIAQRWTDSNKRTIMESRINTLQCLKKALSEVKSHQVKHILSASAIGLYPHSFTKYYEESCGRVSPTFLGKVVSAWENAVDEFSELGLVVSKVRIGLVLDDTEGALPQIVKPTALGFGAAFGSGDQWQSWIHVYDLSRIFVYVIQQELEGVYNGVAPNPITNTELTKGVAKALHKPLFLPNIPEFAMKLVLGEMHILLYESQRVSSKKIEENGFGFTYSNLQPALEDLLQKE
ncbi:TIGR01777 family oxidoreductase [Gelidibacter salicanalis]|uniref:TIGR01777 family oxidoreductase n=1 Tax=Gelidibacter salicanalis TaxID=291193 RepID=A0A934KSN0_9FLAO|nr:TIGR01777 family oxidoreductase [Gelidibacter salicanalis]MBJ7879383.1 TIGR01777 family oxidoreductase [Gelidibacter salicanalis]